MVLKWINEELKLDAIWVVPLRLPVQLHVEDSLPGSASRGDSRMMCVKFYENIGH